MLPADPATRSAGFNAIREIVVVCGETSTQDENRLSQIGRLFGIGEDGVAMPFRKIGEGLR